MWGAGKGSSPDGPESSGERALFRELADMQAAGEARRSARERRGSPSRSFSRSIPLLAAAACFSAFLAVFAGGASAVHDLGLFQLDGNAAVDASPAGEDWNSVVGNGTGSLPLAGSNAISATFVNDPYNIPNGDSAYGAGSSKDIDDVPSWSYTLAGNVNDKLDFEHAGAALYVASNGDPILYFFADRYAQNGDAKVGFWFFKGSVGLEPSPGTHFAGTSPERRRPDRERLHERRGEHLEHRRQGVAERRAARHRSAQAGTARRPVRATSSAGRTAPVRSVSCGPSSPRRRARPGRSSREVLTSRRCSAERIRFHASRASSRTAERPARPRTPS